MTVPSRLQALVRERENGRCAYCRSPEELTVTRFEIDHIVPVSAGGATEESNLCMACPSCNRYKGAHQTAIDPVSQQNVALFHPRRDVWEEHFAWDEQQIRIIGLTLTGRATIEKLRMNRQSLVRLRTLWRKLGVELEKA